MNKKSGMAVAGAAVLALAGTAALGATTHHMTIALPDGGTARIDYSGDVAPRVHFQPPQMITDNDNVAFWTPGFGSVGWQMDSMAAAMDRQMAAMLQQARVMASRTPQLNSATLRDLPAGSESWSVTTVSTGKGSCTRSVHVTGGGERMKPQVVSETSGNCDGAALGNDTAHTMPVHERVIPDTEARTHI